VRVDRRVLQAPDALRWAGAAANLGAALIHFAYAPAHFSEEASHGAFFLAVGWAQLGLALGLALRATPRRAWAGASVLVNGAVIAVWLVSRTAGVPGSGPEPWGLPDGAASALAAVAVVTGLLLLRGALEGSSMRRPGLGAGALVGVLLAGLVTASVTPAVAGEQGHGGDAHAGGSDGMGAMPGMDHGHDGAAADEDWNATRMAALTGYLPADDIEAIRQTNIEYLSEQIRQRSDTLRSLPAAEREARIEEFATWSVDHALEAENGDARADGVETMHSHGLSVWQPITDPDEQAELQRQLREAGTVIPAMATAQDAMDAGYVQVTPYVPGIGAHYLNFSLLTRSGFEPARPEMLLYNGNDPGSELVGLSYATLSIGPPDGFVGPNDIWHVHPSLCSVGRAFVIGPDTTPEQLCDSVGGTKGIGGARLHMAHLWQVPGWESPWGLFSGENPMVNMATSEVGA